TPDARMTQFIQEARKLIALFDRKPFRVNCDGLRCSKRATRISIPPSNISSIMWWCDDCNPYQTTINGPLHIVRYYENALSINANKQELKELIRAMARAKGLPERVGEKEAQQFFDGDKL
ncbi:hypothetical protein ACFL55_00425, partial [Candidatus Latescibacterota bacterium]